jgi:threonine aldolase
MAGGPTTMIDLRSDTVTRPTPAMRQAMATAEVGDDQYGEDPTVAELERRAAELVGKEAAVYVASGTMGNLISVLSHCGRGDELVLGDECHIFWYESGGAATLGGIPFNLRPTTRFGRLDLDDVADAIRPERAGYPRTGAVCIENTHNRCGGAVLPLDYLTELRQVCAERSVPIHMDGARIFNAAAALGVPAAEIAANVDSVQFCLSKGLAAPVGSIVAGSAEFVATARRNRKIVGGAMRQSGVIAAAGLVALNEMIDRLPEDHHRAKRLAQALAEIPGLIIDLDTIQSNIVIFRPPSCLSHEAVITAFLEHGIKISNYGLRGLRMVTHYEINDEAIERTIAAMPAIFAAAVA